MDHLSLETSGSSWSPSIIVPRTLLFVWYRGPNIPLLLEYPDVQQLSGLFVWSEGPTFPCCIIVRQLWILVIHPISRINPPLFCWCISLPVAKIFLVLALKGTPMAPERVLDYHGILRTLTVALCATRRERVRAAVWQSTLQYHELSSPSYEPIPVLYVWDKTGRNWHMRNHPKSSIFLLLILSQQHRKMGRIRSRKSRAGPFTPLPDISSYEGQAKTYNEPELSSQSSSLKSSVSLSLKRWYAKLRRLQNETRLEFLPGNRSAPFITVLTLGQILAAQNEFLNGQKQLQSLITLTILVSLLTIKESRGKTLQRPQESSF